MHVGTSPAAGLRLPLQSHRPACERQPRPCSTNMHHLRPSSCRIQPLLAQQQCHRPATAASLPRSAGLCSALSRPAWPLQSQNCRHTFLLHPQRLCLKPARQLVKPAAAAADAFGSSDDPGASMRPASSASSQPEASSSGRAASSADSPAGSAGAAGAAAPGAGASSTGEAAATGSSSGEAPDSQSALQLLQDAGIQLIAAVLLALKRAVVAVRNAVAHAMATTKTAMNRVDTVLTSLPMWARQRQLQKLQAAYEADPTSTDKFLAYLQALNKSKPAEVIKQVDSHKFNASPAVMVEYFRALVATDRIAEYADESGTGAGESHRSLSQLMKDVQTRVDGEDGAEAPGQSIKRPLHIVLQEAQRKPSNFFVDLVRGLAWYLLTFLLLSVFFLLGSGLARRYAGAGLRPAGMASQIGTPATPSFAPKEYNKEDIPEKSQKTFKDVRGCDEAKAELEEIVEYLKHPEKFTRLGGKLPKGVLLTGPPGTGKTLLAKAVAGEAGVPFFFRAGSEFEEMFVGVGSRRVRSLFAAAKKKAPCIVFIDEIDAVGGSRKQWDNHSRKTLNQLLVEMDGFEENQGVIVMAATNLQETLDPALTRPGRFDRHVAVPLPDVRGRLDILKYYLQNKPLAPDIDPELIARRTAGFSGAELSNLVNEAALIAAKNNKDTITAYMVDEARDKIMMGVERKSMVLSPESLKLTAYHESGHALVALNTAGAKPIHKATIMPRGHALGMVTMTLDGDREYKITKQQLVADIDVCMGGRVAESIIFGEDQVTSGASSDLQQATRTARGMVMQYGMSDEIGPVYVSGDNTSSETEKKVDAEVGRMLREAYARVQELLTVKEADLHRLARALLEHETLTLNEIKEVLAGTFQRTPIASKTYDVEALLGDVGEMPEPVHQQSPEAPPRS